MPKLMLSDETWDRLRGWAITAEDTLDHVLHRVLDAADLQRQSFLQGIDADAASNAESSEDTIGSDDPVNPLEDSGALLAGEPTPTQAYRQPLLEVLYELGGRGESRVVLERIEQKMRGVLTDADYGTTSGRGHTIWHNRASWMRKTLVEDGVLRNDSPRGIRELTPQAISQLQGRFDQ